MKRTITILLGAFLLITVSAQAQQLNGTYWDGYIAGPPPVYNVTLGFVNDTVKVYYGGQSFPISTYSQSGSSFAITDLDPTQCGANAGNYTISITNDTLKFVNVDDTCSGRLETLEGFIWVRSGIDLTEMYLNKAVSFYPNPVADAINLEFTTELIGKNYSIANSLGQIIISDKIESVEERLDFSSIPPGMYFISIEGIPSGGKKFIKL